MHRILRDRHPQLERSSPTKALLFPRSKCQQVPCSYTSARLCFSDLAFWRRLNKAEGFQDRIDWLQTADKFEPNLSGELLLCTTKNNNLSLIS